MKLNFFLLTLTSAILGYSNELKKTNIEKDPYFSAAFSLQNAFTTIADQSIPAVVVISNKRYYHTKSMYPNISAELRPFFGLSSNENSQKTNQLITVGRGSGFFISQDGYILTNLHVIQDAVALEIRLSDGTIYDSEKKSDSLRIVGIDQDSDLAVLQIMDSKKTFPFLKFANSDKAKIGEWAIAIGAPFNLDYSMTVGIISQKGRNDVGKTKFQDYIQTDASINPGNSGGPLLNLKGEVLGINNCILTGGGQGSIGIGFAIASNFAATTAQSLIKYGKVDRAFLGIVIDDLNEKLTTQLKTNFGILVRQILPYSPAEKAKLQVGDIIQYINNEKINAGRDFFSVMAKIPIGEVITLQILRNGEKITLQVQTISPNTKISNMTKIDALGLTLIEDQESLKILKIHPQSSFYRSALTVGQRIISINQQPIKSITDFKKVLQNSQGNLLSILIEKENKERYLMQIKLL